MSCEGFPHCIRRGPAASQDTGGPAARQAEISLEPCFRLGVLKGKDPSDGLPFRSVIEPGIDKDHRIKLYQSHV